MTDFGLPSPGDGVALKGIRVLDLTDETGYEAGRFLADWGAEVIKVEPPQGDSARLRPPFADNVEDPTRSLFFMARNRNKKGITLDLESDEGRALTKKLIASVDVVIETYPVGYLAERGLGYDDLKTDHPGLVYCSITPYGQDGPMSRFRGSDLTVMAQSGFLDLLGDKDRAPLRLQVPQISQHASEAAAGAIMTALFHRENTGEGQYIDTSACQVQVMCGSATNWMTWEVNRSIVKRQGALIETPSGGYALSVFWECADGYVVFVFLPGGMGGGRMMEGMIKWMESEGFDPAPLNEFDWNTYDIDADYATQEFIDRYAEPIRRFFKPKTRDEIFEKALGYHIMLYPANDASTLVENPQLVSRGFWQQVTHDDLGRDVTYPGAPMVMTQTPMRAGERAPHLGEHTDDVLGALGLGNDEIAALRAAKAI